MARTADDLGTVYHVKGRHLAVDHKGKFVASVADDGLSILGMRAHQQITSAQVLALNATPITVVAAPKNTSLAIVVNKIVVYKPAGTAYAGIAAGEDLVFKYTNGSGALAAGQIETTGFLDQTTAETRVVGFPGATGTTSGDVEPVAGAALVAHLLVGEITTGDSVLEVVTYYDLINLTPTS